MDIAASHWSNLEIIQPGVNKGTGLARLAAHYGIEREEVMAFGDHWNDAEMLEWAGESFAMENAIPEIRARQAYRAFQCGRRRCAHHRGVFAALNGAGKGAEQVANGHAMETAHGMPRERFL